MRPAARDFLARVGWGAARIEPLAGDASTRRFHRLTRDGARAVLMDDPGGTGAAFLDVTVRLRSIGLLAPAVYRCDLAEGLLLVQDLGDDTFDALLDRGEPAPPLLAAAVDVLITLHRRFRVPARASSRLERRSPTSPQPSPPPGAEREPSASTLRSLSARQGEEGQGERRAIRPEGRIGGFSEPASSLGVDEGRARSLPVFDADRFVDQAGLFVEVCAPRASRPAFEAAWRAALAPALAVPQSLLLRDFFAGNLIRAGDRTGLLDVQDAGIGPVSYDLASLLHDARRDYAAADVEAAVRRYLDAFPGLDEATFRRSLRVLTAQRDLRIVAIFRRLAANGKPGYLQHLPRLQRRLRHLLATEPALAPVAGWLATHDVHP